MLSPLPDDPKAADELVALRNALRRTTEDRDHWRMAYLRMFARVQNLGRIRDEIDELVRNV